VLNSEALADVYNMQGFANRKLGTSADQARGSLKRTDRIQIEARPTSWVNAHIDVCHSVHGGRPIPRPSYDTHMSISPNPRRLPSGDFCCFVHLTLTSIEGFFQCPLGQELSELYYKRTLQIVPKHVAARGYLGELYVDTGKEALAREAGRILRARTRPMLDVLHYYSITLRLFKRSHFM